MEKERWVSSECEQRWSEERSPWLPSTAAARCTALLSLLLLESLRLLLQEVRFSVAQSSQCSVLCARMRVLAPVPYCLQWLLEPWSP